MCKFYILLNLIINITKKMELVKLSTKKIIEIRLNAKSPDYYLKNDNNSIIDEEFNIILYKKENDRIKEVYLPYGVEKSKLGFVIIEAIETSGNMIIVRVKNKDFMEGVKINKKDFEYVIKKYSKYYTTLSTEGQMFNTDIKLDGIAFSIIHFFYHTSSRTTRVKNIAIIKDPTDTLKEANREAEYIFDMLQSFPFLNSSLYTSVKKSEIEKIFSFYDIVHIAGHIDEKGLLLRDGYYNPWKQGRLPSLIFLNTCRPAYDFLEGLIRRIPINIVYNTGKVEDSYDPVLITRFYEGIIAGYRIGDIVKNTFNNKRVYGWLTNRFIV